MRRIAPILNKEPIISGALPNGRRVFLLAFFGKEASI